MHDAGPSGQGQGAARSGGRKRLVRYSRVVFAKVRTLSFPCGQPRDTAKKDMQEKLGLGRSAARVSKVWLR